MALGKITMIKSHRYNLLVGGGGGGCNVKSGYKALDLKQKKI